jgi:hypothetical protein
VEAFSERYLGYQQRLVVLLVAPLVILRKGSVAESKDVKECLLVRGERFFSNQLSNPSLHIA